MSWISDQLDKGFKFKKTWRFEFTGYDVKGGSSMDKIKEWVMGIFGDKYLGKVQKPVNNALEKVNGVKTYIIGTAAVLTAFTALLDLISGLNADGLTVQDLLAIFKSGEWYALLGAIAIITGRQAIKKLETK
jgi:hypothetical protein